MILPVMEVCFITKKNFIKKNLVETTRFFLFLRKYRNVARKHDEVMSFVVNA